MDQTITCRDCGSTFEFSAGEQEFYSSRGLAAPQRCKACRAARKNERMGGGGGAGPRQMHPATCGKCGAACEVPFKPRPVEEGGRPVLCKACFDAERGSRMS